MSDGFLVIVAVGVLAVVFAVSSVLTNAQWTQDCAAIGAHLVSGKVYECKERGEASK